MKSKELELYSDFLIANSGQATATGLAEVLGQAVIHDKITRFLSEREYTSKDLWRAVKAKFREYINRQLVFCQRKFRLYCVKKEAFYRCSERKSSGRVE